MQVLTKHIFVLYLLCVGVVPTKDGEIDEFV